MSTKLYPWNSAPVALVPTAKGTWNFSNIVVVSMGTEPVGLAASTQVQRNVGTNISELHLLLVSPKLSGAQTITGTLDLLMGAIQTVGDEDACWAVHAWVSVGDTNVVRGTLLTDYRSPLANEWPTTAQGHGLDAPQTLSSVSAQDGDRIIVELGPYFRGAQAAGRSSGLYYGVDGADLTLTDTAVTTHAGQVLFSQTLTWQTPITGRISRVQADVLGDPGTAKVRVSQITFEILRERRTNPGAGSQIVG